MQRLLSLAALLTLGLALAGCSSIYKRPPAPVVYQLQAASQPLMAQPPSLPANTRLEVSLPTVPAGYDRERIALSLDNGRRLDYYAGARWAADLPLVAQDAITKSLLLSLPGAHIDTAEHMTRPSHRLRVDVISFAPVYTGAATTTPQVRVALRLVLTRLGDQAVLADVTLANTQMPAANTLGAVTGALETGLHQVLRDAMPRLSGALAATPRR